MATKKRFKSVSDFVDETSPSAEFAAAFKVRVAQRRVVKQLVVLRGVKGQSQQDVAKTLGCTQSRVSKLEVMKDRDARIGDLEDYASAVDSKFVYGLQPKGLKPVDKVKCHVFAVKRHMDELAEIAKTDEEVAKGVAGFFCELFVNFARLFGESVTRLPLAPNDQPYLGFRHAAVQCNLETQVAMHTEECFARGSL